MREKGLDTQAEAEDFFRKTGYQKPFEQGGEASSFMNIPGTRLTSPSSTPFGARKSISSVLLKMGNRSS